ncbi:hypothetical protein ACHAWF_007399 [Thalassiosira exigua]
MGSLPPPPPPSPSDDDGRGRSREAPMDCSGSRRCGVSRPMRRRRDRDGGCGAAVIHHPASLDMANGSPQGMRRRRRPAGSAVLSMIAILSSASLLHGDTSATFAEAWAPRRLPTAMHRHARRPHGLPADAAMEYGRRRVGVARWYVHDSSENAVEEGGTRARPEDGDNVDGDGRKSGHGHGICVDDDNHSTGESGRGSDSDSNGNSGSRHSHNVIDSDDERSPDPSFQKISAQSLSITDGSSGSSSRSNANNNDICNEEPAHSAPLEPFTKLDLRILLIDNHDSYTYNLYQCLSEATTQPVEVIMNDAFPSWDDFLSSLADNDSDSNIDSGGNYGGASLSDKFDCIVLSPGPGRPSREADMGMVLEAIRRNPDVPVLGVCLGHQALGHAYGKEVTLSPCGPVHGLTSAVSYDEEYGEGASRRDGEPSDADLKCQLFKGLPQGFDAVRYHSLVVDFSDAMEGSDVEPIAWCDGLARTTASSETSSDESELASGGEAVCMALRHKTYPHYGVQFHPESVGTGDAGRRLLWNFCEFAHRHEVQSAAVKKANGALLPDRTGAKVVHGDNSHLARDAQTNGCKTACDHPSPRSKYRVLIHKVARDKDNPSSLPSPEQVFEALYGSRPNSFWLDSSTGESRFRGSRADANNVRRPKETNAGVEDAEEGCPIADNSRFSIMGSDDGPLSEKVEYFGREHDPKRRGLRVTSDSGVQELDWEDVLSYLRRGLEDRMLVDNVEMVTFDEEIRHNSSPEPTFELSTVAEFGPGPRDGGNGDPLPFDYRGGYVGYLGYEMRHDTQCRIFEREGGSGCAVGVDYDDSTVGSGEALGKTNPSVPTAAFLFVDRSLLYDHLTGDWFIIGVANNAGPGPGEDADRSDEGIVDVTVAWMHTMKLKLEAMQRDAVTKKAIDGSASDSNSDVKGMPSVAFVPNRSKAQYELDISRSHEEIRNGESYELCVTNQLETEFEVPLERPARAIREPPLDFYKLLRKKNPAPFSALMNFYGEEEYMGERSASLSICCSSPERFLSVKKAQIASDDDGDSPNQQRPTRRFVVESKPIKGTAARYTGAGNGMIEPEDLVEKIDSQIASKLRESVKDRAENLMIVDLLRNDLGRVCEVGSVHVPKLMHIESYATVHQMVSTVRGTLDGETTNAIDVIEACFPGGSMTGAPKQRTMEILDEIEQGVSRGPYSGCLGYISLNGCMDMNIVIRSAVLTPTDDDRHDKGMGAERWKASIGCGGAITALSNSEDEYEEMLLKSRVVRGSISDWVARMKSGDST